MTRRNTKPVKLISEEDLTDALTQHFIDKNMGMPGPRQERMAADVWFRLPVTSAEPANADLDAAFAAGYEDGLVAQNNAVGVHVQHCNFGENADTCKYGNDEDCPALSNTWSWFGKALQRAEKATRVTSSIDDAWKIAKKARPSKAWRIASVEGEENSWYALAIEQVKPAWSQETVDWARVVGTGTSPAKALLALADKLKTWKPREGNY